MAHPNAIPDILEEHFEEVAFLWGQRRGAVTSPSLTLREVLDLEDRIEAHLEGLMIGEADTVKWVTPGLIEGSPDTAVASVLTLVRLGRFDGLEAIWAAWGEATGPRLAAFAEALTVQCPDLLKPRLEAAAAGAPSEHALRATEILAGSVRSLIAPSRVESFLAAEEPLLRQGGWRLVAFHAVDLPQRCYDRDLLDEDPGVRRACLWAGAWTGQNWVLDHCRKSAESESPDPFSVRLWSVLARPEDLRLALELARTPEFGPQRFEWLGAFGHHGVMGCVLEGFRSENPREAVAAGKAFTKMTGVDVDSPVRVELPPAEGEETPDDFEKEFLEDAFLPDLAKAEAHWKGVVDTFSKETRWCRGVDMSTDVDAAILAKFDRQSYGEQRLRDRMAGGLDIFYRDLEVYPTKSS